MDNNAQELLTHNPTYYVKLCMLQMLKYFKSGTLCQKKKTKSVYWKIQLRQNCKYLQCANVLCNPNRDTIIHI